ncbi:MAG: hypothetical protein IPP28_09705 [Xanthomonadales bacterium]|nr:hypothetical protein [Xanthomonadales bacterium]
MSFLAELRRRNVIRMAGLYLVGAWLITQVAATLLPVFDAPTWVMKALVALLAIGFFAALVFAWVFEWTPQGLKRDGEVAPDPSIAPQTARRMDRTIIMVLALALAYFGFDKFVMAPQRNAASAETTAVAPTASEHSIAVLPFANMSGKADEEYFSDGMTEELLNVLAKVPRLQVVARTSVFQFKGKSGDVREIGRALGVGHIIEGSVRRDGDQVRITAQLIRVADGFHVWSESYDRKLDSVFALQDEIAARIGAALKVSLGVDAPGAGRAAIDPAAYDEYLKGRALLRARTDVPAAIAYFQAATQKAPGLAAAWSSLSLACEAWHANNKLTPAQLQQSLACEADAAQRAVELEPNAAASEHALANMARARLKFSDAERHYLRAIELDPGYPDALEDYAELLFMVGRVEESSRETDKLVKLDPLFIIAWVRMRDVVIAQDRRADIAKLTPMLRSKFPDSTLGWYLPYSSALAHGRVGEARAALAELKPIKPEQIQAHELLLAWALREPGVDEAGVATVLGGETLVGQTFYYILRGDVAAHGRFVEEIGVSGKQYYFARLHMSMPAGHAMLRDPLVKAKLVEYGFVAYWREKGWPPICRSLGDSDFECGVDAQGTGHP